MHPVVDSHFPFAVIEVSPAMIKQGMRERIRAERRRRGPARRESAATALAAVALEVPEIARATCVAAYVSTPSAPGTLPLRRALRRAGTQVLLPVLHDDGHVRWAVDGDSEQPARAFGSGPLRYVDRYTALPAGRGLQHDAVAAADVVIVPALAVDTLGNRLGQGGGFYDRMIAELDPAVPVFAVVHDGEVLDAAVEAVPFEAHDQLVDAILTPQRCLRLLPATRR